MTDAEYEELAKWEFVGGLYLDDEKRPCVPDYVIFSLIRNGARTMKRGKDVEKALRIPAASFPLIYDGPKSYEDLWNHKDELENRTFVDFRMVRIGQSRVQRARPIFRDWQLELEVEVNTALLNPNDVKPFLVAAGIEKRLGDARSLGYGSFEVV